MENCNLYKLVSSRNNIFKKHILTLTFCLFVQHKDGRTKINLKILKFSNSLNEFEQKILNIN